MNEYKIIDISAWNTGMNYSQLKSYDIHGAILRVTERGNITDGMFDTHYKGIKNAGLGVYGVYKFSYALSIPEIQAEANAVVKVLKKYSDFKGVVFLDLEYDQQANLGKAMLTQMIEAFRKIVVNSGYRFGIYSNLNWHNNILDASSLPYDYWVASYPANDNGTVQERLRPSFNHLKGWQFTESFRINGGKYDMSLFDKDYIDGIGVTSSVKKEVVKDLESIKTNEVVYTIDSGTTAEDILNIFRSWIGKNEVDGSFKEIINLYNSIRPLPVGYTLQMTDEWCAASISAAFWKAGAIDLIGGGECSCPRMITIFQNMGIWQEDGTITPPSGAIILFAWNQSYQPNNSTAMHVGIVEYVENGVVHTIEGNSSERVARRTYPVGSGVIRGYGLVKYGSDVSTAPSQPSTASSKTKGEETAKPSSTPASTASTGANTGAPSKERKFYGTVEANILNCRTFAGTEYPRLNSIPSIVYGTVVEVCDTVPDSNGDPWYYIRINGAVYGFVSAEYIKKA